ncbi:MAG: peptidylprolyl isomerase [Defluviitaleaceae bacterium]|nr:peptidylprolyl isomerase [Defluviitaleaceae bacterium]
MMKKVMRFLFLIVLLAGVAMFTACDEETIGSSDLDSRFSPVANPVRPDVTVGVLPTPLPWPLASDLLERRPVALQLQPMTVGEEVVVFETNHGHIVMRLFPQAAPLAVENFMTHVANGFYDGLIFHRVIEGFMIQGGCSLGTGTGGGSIWGMGFGPEHNYDLWHFNGALAMAQTGSGNSIGSQFYIVHRDFLPAMFTHEFEHILASLDDVIYPPDWDGTSPHLTVGDVYLREVFEHYLEVGGTPDLDFPFNSNGPNFGHTVFGQVVHGMDVVNSIATTRTGANDRPTDDVIIERAFIAVYTGE